MHINQNQDDALRDRNSSHADKQNSALSLEIDNSDRNSSKRAVINTGVYEAYDEGNASAAQVFPSLNETDRMQLPPIPSLFWLGAAFVSAWFCTGFQIIPLADWLQPVFLLVYFTERNNAPKWILWNLLALIAMAVGTSVALGGVFNDPSWEAGNVLILFALALAKWAFLIIFCFRPTVYYMRYFTSALAQTIVFPVLWTSLWALAAIWAPLGSYSHPAYSQSSIRSIVQFSSFFGIDGIAFLMGWVTSSLYHEILLWSPALMPQFKTSKVIRQRIVLCCCLTFAYLYGSVRDFSDNFFQQSINYNMYPTLSMGCVVRQVVRNTSDILQETSKLAANGSRIIVWAEAAVLVTDDAEEKKLLDEVQTLAAATSTYIAASYWFESNQSDIPIRNMVAFAKPDGLLAFNYQKVHPVPGVEAGVQPGDKPLPVIDTEYGRIGTGVCFDLDFPNFIRRAGYNRVDIFLHPSWTWGPIADLHMASNSFRAVENGFYYFRCASQGYSGAVSTYYRQDHSHQSLHSDSFSLNIPLHEHRITVYPFCGFVFQFICMAAAIVLYLYPFLSRIGTA